MTLEQKVELSYLGSSFGSTDGLKIVIIESHPNNFLNLLDFPSIVKF